MSKRYWLVRNQSLKITGPYPESVLIDRISKGMIQRTEEVCPSLGYWFSLGDLSEVKNHFDASVIEKLFTIPEGQTHQTKKLDSTQTLEQPSVARYESSKTSSENSSLWLGFWLLILFGLYWFFLRG